MSRCRQTDALLDATFAGSGPTRTMADHLARCSECARALAQARRLDAELHRIGMELTSVPLPASTDIDGGRPGTPAPLGGRPVRYVALVGSAVAVLLVAAIGFGGGMWIGSFVQPAFDLDIPFLTGPVDLERAGNEAARRDAAEAEAIRAEVERAARREAEARAAREGALLVWLDRARTTFVATHAPETSSSQWNVTQVEHCGDTVIALWSPGPGGPHAFGWAVGETDVDPLQATGLAASLFDTRVAELRARLPVCEMVVDPALDATTVKQTLLEARAAWDAQHAEERAQGLPPKDPPIPNAVEVESSNLVVSTESQIGKMMILLERARGDAVLTERIVLLSDGPGTPDLLHASAANKRAVPYVVYRDGSFVDVSAFFAITSPPGAAALDLIAGERRMRFTVSGAGLFVDGDGWPEDPSHYALIDRDGAVLAEGAIQEWGHE